MLVDETKMVNTYRVHKFFSRYTPLAKTQNKCIPAYEENCTLVPYHNCNDCRCCPGELDRLIF